MLQQSALLRKHLTVKKVVKTKKKRKKKAIEHIKSQLYISVVALKTGFFTRSKERKFLF